MTYDEALKKLLESSHQMHGENSLTEDSAKILLERGLKKAAESNEDEDKWEFTRDLRHLVRPLYGYAYEIMKQVSTEVKCPHLIIKAKKGNLFELPENVEETLDIFRESNPSFKIVDVEGNHHAHLNTPENVWLRIASFLENTHCQHQNSTLAAL